ncbi:MAG: esterase [Clostridia bacterium]|nr:esterase [Clostridia bacterium]
MEIAPELYTAFLHCSSQWDGRLEPLVEAMTPVYLATGENDSYYGSSSVKETYQKLATLYKAKGLNDEQIEKLVVLDLRDQAYFNERGIRDQHGGGLSFAHEEDIMGWLFDEHKEVTKVKKLLAAGVAFTLAIASLAGCQSDTGITEDPGAETTVTDTQNGEEDNTMTVNIPQTGDTVAVPSEYKHAAAKQGSVTRLDYDSKDYVRGGGAITKTAYVYTPYGYDENDTETRYDILYLMHGWGGRAGEYFDNASQKNMFDILIEKGDIKPIIIVSATFYNENSDRDFSSSIEEFRQFHRDFEENLMPTVEGMYHTYAKSTSEADLKASRDHRAFGGFSLGSVTTWLQFCYDYDYIRWFLPMSGSCWYYGTYGDFQIEKNVDFIEQLVKNNDLDRRGYFIYHAVGTNDTVKSQSIDMADEMLTRETFTPDHYVFYQKDGGYHDFNAVQEYLYNALPLFFPFEPAASASTAVKYTADSAIDDVISDPVFGDFGRLIFPANTGYYSGNTLGDLSLTWYNHIDPDKTVEIVNYMSSHAAAGDTIFYDIYTDAEKAADPEKKDTGLFFFKGDPGAKFAVVNAGGGFAFVGAMHDSFPHALELSKIGYNAFALIYRPGWETAMEDLGRALSFLYDHAEELEIDMNGYSLWGGSAGARMAATLGNSDELAYYTGRSDIPQAAAVIMQYTGHSQTSKNDAPTYACCGTSDGIANYRTMENRLNTLKSYGIPTEFHAYSGLPHGFGLGTGTVAEGWINDAVRFWERNMK